jgi:hypothetical protein
MVMSEKLGNHARKLETIKALKKNQTEISEKKFQYNI